MFVELAPRLLVDPTEVAMLAGSSEGATRVYLRGARTKQDFLVVARPVAVVAAELEAARRQVDAARAAAARQLLGDVGPPG